MGKKSRRVRNKTETQPAAKSANNSDFKTLGTLPPTVTHPDGKEIGDQYTLHKQAFDRIINKYQLDAPDKAEAIAEMLTVQTSSEEGLTPKFFAEKFGTDVEEAVVFLEWIKCAFQTCQCVSKCRVLEHFSRFSVLVSSGPKVQGGSDRYRKESRA